MITIEHQALLTVDNPGTGEDLERACGLLMEEMLKLEETCDFSDTAISLDLDSSTVLVEVLATGTTVPEAVNHATACVRTAIHASGGGTPNWEHIRSVESKSGLIPA